MTNFIVLFHIPDSTFKAFQAKGVIEMRKNAAEWVTWKEEFKAHIVDEGSPLINPTRVSVDGSFNEGEEAPKAYSIMKAYTKEDLVELLKGHPHLSSGKDATIEILESLPFIPGK